MMPMQDKYFIDTNIFLYAFSTKDSAKQKIAKKIVLNTYTVSTQVINEACSNFLKKLSFSENMIEAFIDSAYTKYTIVNFSQSVFIEGSTVRSKYKYSYYDSLIIAAALESQCTVLYSEDMQHEQIIENRLKIINPFKGQI